ncbi:MAG: phosphatase PAP2 family protein [Dysgonamonadaceae bacterium]|jgi:hypothetical protein|nr:phosphatase PAP2 family protein [Dysgonamonadaceae bacterium]
MKKNILLISVALFFYSNVLYSQEQTDSIVSQTQKKEREFSPKQLILPASLFTIGALGLGNNYVKSINEDIKRKVAGFRSDYTKADDYIQYLPVVSVYGLSIAGAKPKHDYIDRTLIVATSYLSMGIIVNSLKYTIYSPRPNFHSNNSFPSGHTATAFMGAELVRQEYWDASPWYGIAAYSVAASVGLMRIYNESHWATDVLAGAGAGILSARIGYWLLPFNKRLTGRGKTIASRLIIAPYYMKQQGGIGLSYQF